MKKALLFFLVLFYSTIAFCQHSYKQQLNHIATITFPDTPKMEQDSDLTLYSVSTHSGVYVSQVTVGRKSLKDLFTSHINDTIYEGVITALIDTVKGKLLYKKNIDINGLDGVEFCYTTNTESLSHYRCQQMFYFNNTLLLYGYWSQYVLPNKDSKDFFSTFKVTLADDEIRQTNFSDIAFRFGYFLGILLIIGIVVLLGLGVVFIIKKFAYKKS